MTEEEARAAAQEWYTRWFFRTLAVHEDIYNNVLSDEGRAAFDKGKNRERLPPGSDGLD
jgi:hypothetical protein